MRHKFLWKFEIQMDHLILARRQNLVIINKKQENLSSCRFWYSMEYRVKIKESEKIDKYLDHARELKRLQTMWVMVIPVVSGALGMITEGLEIELEQLEIVRRMKTIQTTTFLRLTRILKRVQTIWGNMLSLRLQWKPTS